MTFISTRLKKIARKKLSAHVVWALSISASLVMILPLIIISFYAHPVHDDFPHTLAATEAWMRTGSLGAVVAAAWEHTLLMYNTWQGTFVAMFLSAFQPMVFSPKLFFLTPLCVLAGLCLSAGYFSKALICHRLKGTGSLAAVFFTLLLMLFILFLPSAREVIYWASGTPYTLSLIMLFTMLGLLMKLHESAFSFSYGVRCGLLFLCGIVLGGCPYPLALGGAVGFLFVTLWAYGKRSPARLGSLCALLGTILALVLVVAAPGNYIRQERVGHPMTALQSIIQSIVECLEITGQWFSPQLTAIALLLIPLLLPVLQDSGLTFRHPFLFAFGSFSILAASFVPPIYATGVTGYQVERVLSSLYMLFVLLALLNLVYLAGCGTTYFHSMGTKLAHWGEKGLPLGLLVLSLGLLVWGLFSNAILSTPSIAAAKSLVTGEAAHYHQEMTQREEAIAASESNAQAISAIAALQTEPVVLPVDMLPYQKESGVPAIMHRYFRMQQLGSEYGPGHIPQAEWEALDAWENP